MTFPTTTLWRSKRLVRPLPWFMAAAMLLLSGSGAMATTLEQFISRIKSSHPYMKREAIGPQVEATERQRLAGDKDWILRITPNARHTESNLAQPGQPETATIYGTRMSLEKTIWATGTRIRFTADTQYVDQTWGQQLTGPQNKPPGGGAAQNPGLSTEAQYQTGVGVNISQPLLQNRGGAQDRVRYDAAEYQVEGSQAKAYENQKDFLLQMAESFVDWALAQERVKIAGERVKAEQEAMGRVGDKAKSGRMAPQNAALDAARAEDAVMSARRNLALAEAAMKSLRARLAELAKSQKMNRESAELRLYETSAILSAEKAKKRAIGQSGVVRALSAQKKQLATVGEGLADKSDPQLTLNLGAGLKGEDPDYSQSLGMDKQEWNASLKFVYPIGNNSATQEVKKNRLQRMRVEEDIRAARLDVSAQVVDIITRIKETDKALAVSREHVAAATVRATEEARIYSKGKGDFALVQLSRDNEEKARMLLAETSAERWKLKLALDAALGAI
ncbi:MAG: TolC family protein [Nitrospinota bacterium]|nr:TolC family protein [Nitrospinota bacterium]